MKLLSSLAVFVLLLGCTTTDFYQQAADSLFPEDEEEAAAVVRRQGPADVDRYTDFRGDVGLCVSELESTRRVHILSHFTPTDAAIELFECVEKKGWRLLTKDTGSSSSE